MPRVYVRKTERKGWSEEDCLLAIKELNDGAGLRATASKYKIPPRSLKRRMQKGPNSSDSSDNESVVYDSSDDDATRSDDGECLYCNGRILIFLNHLLC